QEDRHQDQDEGDARRAPFHELDEALIRRLMGRIVHAVGGRVGYFAMICHCCPQSIVGCCEQLPQTKVQGNGAQPNVPRLSAHSEGQLSLIQRVRPSSFTSPAASERIIAAASASGTSNSIPFTPRKVYSAS